MSAKQQIQSLRTHQNLVQQRNSLPPQQGTINVEQIPWAAMMQGFLTVLRRAELEEAGGPQSQQATWKMLLDGHGRSRHKWAVGQQKTADDFNLLDVLQATNDELRHSAMLAWLLDKRLEHSGTHAQGNLGFRLFLKELRLPTEYAESSYWVRREVVGDKSRVDVEVAARGQFIIHIENKLGAAEGSDQTGREWEDLGRRAAALRITRSRKTMHALFLTPDGRPPQNSNFQAVSWSRIARVVESFAGKAIPPDVRLFATHYAKALRKFVVEESEILENRYDKGTL